MVRGMWSHENLIAGVEAETNQAKYESMDWTAVGTPFFLVVFWARRQGLRCWMWIYI
jgi:hypothetical protein